jgi:hypothetical protein
VPGLIATAAAASALLLPGLGLELWLVRKPQWPLVRGIRAFLLSLAFWPVAAEATRLAGVSLEALAWVSLALGALLVGLAFTVAPRRHSLGNGGGSWALLAGFAALTALHLLPMRSWTVAPGADMSMHTLMTRLVWEAGRLPASYEPLYPFQGFGSFLSGLPVTAAVLSLLGGLPTHRTSLAVALLAYPALAGGLFLVARRFTADAAALVASWAVATTCGPYAVLEWGGNPTILSLALGFAAVAPAVAPHPGALERDGAFTFPLLAAGSGLAHVIPLLGLAWAFPLAAIWWIAQAPRGSWARLLAAWMALAVAGGLLLGLPHLAAPHLRASAGELAWAVGWQRDSAHSYRGTWADFPLTIWGYLWGRLGGGGLAAAALGIAGALAGRDRRHLPWIAFSGAVLLLVLNSRYWILPGSYALYPERMAMLLWAPLAALLAAAAATAWRLAAAWRSRALRWGAVLLALLVAAAAAGDSVRLRMRLAGRRVAVAESDLRAMRWIETRLPAGAVVENNYGDAGLWIPALAFRAVTGPHLHVFYQDDLAAWSRSVEPGYLYLGERKIYGVRHTPEEIRSRPDRYRLLHAEGEAALYEIVRHGSRP